MSGTHYLEPARTVVARFGEGDIAKGVAAISALVGCDPSWVYRWMYQKDRGGRDGAIPPDTWPMLLQGAQDLGVPLSLADINPELAPFLPPQDEAA